MTDRNTHAGRIVATAWGLALMILTVGPAGAHDTKDAGEGATNYTRSVQSYAVPPVTLRNRQGEPVELQKLVADDRPVLLQFIFTSCQTVCPMLTAIMAQAQEALRDVRADTRIISISIDPDYDTPERLDRYAAKHGAEGDWVFLTGDWRAVRKTLNAFDAMYEGQNKMYHKPYTFIRSASDTRWVRLIGLMGADRLVAEYRQLLKRTTAEVALDTPAPDR